MQISLTHFVSWLRNVIFTDLQYGNEENGTKEYAGIGYKPLKCRFTASLQKPPQVNPERLY